MMSKEDKNKPRSKDNKPKLTVAEKKAKKKAKAASKSSSTSED
jgi:hypothetical protein